MNNGIFGNSIKMVSKEQYDIFEKFVQDFVINEIPKNCRDSEYIVQACDKANYTFDCILSEYKEYLKYVLERYGILNGRGTY